LQHLRDFLIGGLFQVTQSNDIPVLFGELRNEGMHRVVHILLAIRIVGIGQGAEHSHFRFDAGILHVQICKSKGPSAAEASSFVTASIDRDAAEPGIKGPVDVERFQGKIDFAQYELKDVVRIGCRAGVPAYQARKLVLILLYQGFKSSLIAILAFAD
jgi:hypothetical protein